MNNLSNNNGRVNYNGNLKIISRFKFSTIDSFDQFEPEIIFDKDNIIFFDNKGSILKFNQFSKLIWKKNFYSKSEKKLKPLLSFASDKKTLIVGHSQKDVACFVSTDRSFARSEYCFYVPLFIRQVYFLNKIN